MAKPGAPATALCADAKAMIQRAFEDLGGVERLVEWANDSQHPGNLTAFYTQIWPRIVPKDIKSEVAGKNGGPVRMSISWEVGEEPEDAEVVSLPPGSPGLFPEGS